MLWRELLSNSSGTVGLKLNSVSFSKNPKLVIKKLCILPEKFLYFFIYFLVKSLSQTFDWSLNMVECWCVVHNLKGVFLIQSLPYISIVVMKYVPVPLSCMQTYKIKLCLCDKFS